MLSRPDEKWLLPVLGLVACSGAMVLAWTKAASQLIPPGYRLNLWDLAWEHWRYTNNLAAYLDWRWPQMIEGGYPQAFLAAALPGALAIGLLVAVTRWTWIAVVQAALGWAVGGLLGLALMRWAPLPSEALRGLAMPGLALLLGVLAPVLLLPPRDPAPLRGTRIMRHENRSWRAARQAMRKGQTALAGVVLHPQAEVRHLAVIGVTGSGKSVALQGLMQTAFARGDRHVIADPDGSALRLFHREGDVILNPADARSARWDMLAEIEEPTDYRLLAETVVQSAQAEGGSEWVSYAREVFAACLETWHRHALGDTEAFVAAMATAGRDKLAQLCEGTAAQRYFEAGNEKMLAGIMGTLAPALGSLRPLAGVQGAPFSVRRWMRQDRGTLWMPYRAKQIPALRGLISCWIGLAISEALSLPPSPTRRIWFHVDELDALGRIQGLKDALARLRKVGGCVVLGLQSIAQVRAVYGEAEANTIVENCDNKLILRCGASERGGTARFASQVIGEREVEREETTTSRGRGWSSSTSHALRRQREPAVMDSEIMQLASCTGYLKLATRPEWLRVAFQPAELPVRAEAWMPAASPMPAAAE